MLLFFCAGLRFLSKRVELVPQTYRVLMLWDLGGAFEREKGVRGPWGETERKGQAETPEFQPRESI